MAPRIRSSVILINPISPQIAQSLPSRRKAVPREDLASGEPVCSKSHLSTDPEFRHPLASSHVPATDLFCSCLLLADLGCEECAKGMEGKALETIPIPDPGSPGAQLGTPTLRTGRLR